MERIDPNIALGFRMPQIQDPLVATARAQEIGVNALKMQEYQRGVEQENKLRELIASGADLNAPETLRQMYSISPKMGTEFEKSRATIKKETLGTQKLESELVDARLKQSSQLLNNVTTPDEYIAWHEANHKDPVLGPLLASRGITADQSRAKIMVSLNQPGGFQRLINESKLGVQKFAEMNTISAAQQQTADLTRRGQDITLRGQDLGRIPVGYRQTDTGAIEPIPGGPTTTTLSPKEIQVREAKRPQATLALKTFEDKTSTLEKDINELMNHPGLSSITGIAAGRLPGITAEGRAAEAIYNRIVKAGGFKELQEMRNASPTGGALGQVSNQENTSLQQTFAAIDRTQEAKDIKKQLAKTLDELRASKGRVREAFDMTYDYRPADSASPSAAPATPAPTAGGNSVTIPGGKVLTFPTPEAAAAYKKAAGL
jgi:hypothetical protein